MSTADLAPDRAEIARRLAAAARQAAGQGLDALVVLEPANVYYLSGFRTTLHTRFTAVALRAETPEQAIMRMDKTTPCSLLLAAEEVA